ncbi:hypothetical protein ANCCEY_05925 [Ancylostoma ceylanicum]|uniref:Uncharacterized protein n=1 Tax=Ancylostoma ceylanicum TaxID=53326 RepID=A0A0D6LY26_9BILA|nr:hypothetical protein ANCCEY_05925 [Ancylostoma ceylanicum]
MPNSGRLKETSAGWILHIEEANSKTVFVALHMAILNKNGGDLPSDLAVVQSVSLENASDSERAEKEIDRIIAEAFMLEPHCSGTSLPSFSDVIVQGESGGSRTEFEDEDPETLSMRLNLIESLQNKLKSVEKEEGEVTDEGEEFADEASKSRELERKSKGSSAVGSSSHSRRSRKSERDAPKKKSETASKQPVPELSITLPVEQCSMNASDVVVTTGEDTPKTTAERVVDTSKSSSSETSGGERSEAPQRPLIERIHLRDDPHFSQNSTSTPRPSPRLPRRSFNSEMLGVDQDIPLPPPPIPPRPIPVSPPCEKDFVLLPPPPAPPVFPQPVSMVEKCNPSSITVQVREGGGRVAQLSSNTRVNEASTSAQKRPEASSSHHPEQPPPPPITTEHYPDNYEDVGMDVESSRSSCISDFDHGDSTADASPRHRLLSDSDEAQLREMLLNQVTLHRKRLAESAAHSSSGSVCEARLEGVTSQNQSTCSNEDEKNSDIKNVLTQSRSADAANGFEECRTLLGNDSRAEKMHNGNSESDRCNSFEGPMKKRKLDESGVSEEYYSLRSPPCNSLSVLESLLAYRENQSRLNDLDGQISKRMSSLNSSLRRRAEIMKQLEELEIDIDAERAGCRLLMQRRNSIRREVERYEERKLDLLLEAEWHSILADLYNISRRPSDTQRTRKNEGRSPVEEAANVSQSAGPSMRPSEEIPSPAQVLSHEEEQMRLKLLARMKRGASVRPAQEPGTIPGVEEQDQATTPFGSVEECCNQSTQTQGCEDVMTEKLIPLYRAHGKDEELSPEEVLSMMIKYAPGLVDSADDSDPTSQVEVLKAKRLPNERFGLFARRLLEELPSDKRPANRRNSREQCTGSHAK